MIGARNQFIKALRCFPTVDEITIGELHSHLRTTANPVTISRFIFTLMYHKLHSYVQPLSRSHRRK
jgi:hypothetical protein